MLSMFMLGIAGTKRGRGMKKIAITGGIATGKSTVIKMIKDLGYDVLSSDEIARRLTKKGEIGYNRILEAFGADILDETGEIDRRKLGDIVFNDSEKKSLLESILHPLIRMEMDKMLVEIGMKNPCSPVFIEIPLLFEVKAEDRFDYIVVVYVPKELQIKRLMERDGLSYREAEIRLKSQIDIEVKRQKAHFVIDNSGSIEDTKKQVFELIDRLRKV